VLSNELLVLDLIYAKTRLLRDAHAAGATTLDGELMLLHQGAAAFTLWTGQPAPLELMQSKLARLAPAVCVPRRASRPVNPRWPPPSDRVPLPHCGRVAWTGPRRHHRGRACGPRLTEDAIAVDLARRQKGYGRGRAQQIEQDRAEILGGVRHG
jgi:hypothetical protein